MTVTGHPKSIRIGHPEVLPKSPGYDGPMPQTREHILLSRQVGVFRHSGDSSLMRKKLPVPSWGCWRAVFGKDEGYGGHGCASLISAQLDKLHLS